MRHPFGCCFELLLHFFLEMEFFLLQLGKGLHLKTKYQLLNHIFDYYKFLEPKKEKKKKKKKKKLIRYLKNK